MKMRYLLKRGEGGRPRESVLQEIDKNGWWHDVPTVYEEDLKEEKTNG